MWEVFQTTEETRTEQNSKEKDFTFFSEANEEQNLEFYSQLSGKEWRNASQISMQWNLFCIYKSTSYLQNMEIDFNFTHISYSLRETFSA